MFSGLSIGGRETRLYDKYSFVKHASLEQIMNQKSFVSLVPEQST